MTLTKALQIVDHHNANKNRVNKRGDFFINSFSAYAEARKIALAAGYVWTVKYGGQ